jgi:hypothetical protein
VNFFDFSNEDESLWLVVEILLTSLVIVSALFVALWFLSN